MPYRRINLVVMWAWGVVLSTSVSIPPSATGQSSGSWSNAFEAAGLHFQNGSPAAVYALAADADGNIYAGGLIDSAGAVPVNNIAMWNGQEWAPVGEGFNGAVYALAVARDGSVYAGGDFSMSGSTPIASIAKLVDGEWVSLAASIFNFGTPGEGPSVRVITEHPASNILFIGGGFTSINGVEMKGLATFDGESWQEFEGGFQGAGCVDSALDDVHDIAFEGDDRIHFAGNMLRTGELSIGGLATWTGTAWETISRGIEVSECRSLFATEMHDDALFVGGSFTGIGASAASGVARWDGSEWYPLVDAETDSLAGWVAALHSSTGALYIGGSVGYSIADRSGVVSWSDDTVQELGSGLNSGAHVFAIASVGSKVYVGGEFVSEAGGHNSDGIALWESAKSDPIEEPAAAPHVTPHFVTVYPNPVQGTATIRFAVPLGWTEPIVVEAYDLIGRRHIVATPRQTGKQDHVVHWRPDSLPAGSYFLRLVSGSSSSIWPVVLLREN